MKLVDNCMMSNMFNDFPKNNNNFTIINKMGSKKHFYGDNNWEGLSVACVSFLWLFLFLPFRLYGFPAYFGQIEEWILSAVILSVASLFLFTSIYRKQQFTFRISVCDILLILYLAYILFRLDEYLTRKENILVLYTLTWLYIHVRISNTRYVYLFIQILIISFFFQLSDAFYRHDKTWNLIPEITGVFHNTGIWGCFAGTVSVGIFGLFLFSRQKKVFLSILFLFTLVILVYSQSRAAWIGAFVGILFLTVVFLWKKYGSRMIRPTIIIILFSIPVFLYTAQKAYLLKPASANGRIYIWKITSKMLSENLWLGIGIDKFKAKYMYFQAVFLSQNPDSPFVQIADDVVVPFCEPLKILIEQGIIGFAFIVAIFLSALFAANKKKGLNPDERHERTKGKTFYAYTAILITLLLFSCFSYPFTYIQFLFILIVSLSALSSFQSCYSFVVRRNKTWLYSLVFCVLVAGCVSTTAITYAVHMKRLHNHTAYFDISKTRDALPAFIGMESILKNNHNYLVAYANFLSLSKEYGRAIEKYTASLSYRASYYTFLELGRNYELLGDTCLALKSLETANRMIPSRFEPLYLQIWICHKYGQYSQADSLTTLFLQKERKVDAIRIDRMVKDVREWEKERRKEDGELRINIKP